MEGEDSARNKLKDKYLHNEVFRVDLTGEEVKGLNMIMPKGYSIQIDPKRKDKSQPKKKTPQELLLQTSDPLRKANAAVSISSIPAPKKGAQKVQLISQALKPCVKILEQLKQHKCGWPFLQPVDVEALNIPQYRQIVKEPMDLSTIQSKLKGGKYQNPIQFHEDVIKIFNNSYTFNSATEDFIKITMELQKYYYRISGEPKPAQDKALPKLVSASSKQQKKKKKVSTGGREFNDSLPMTTEEKKELAFHLQRLAKEHIRGVRNIVFDSNSQQNEFNLQVLSQKKLRELQKYVRMKITEMENALHFSSIQKSEQQSLDELESEITEEFIIEPLYDEKDENVEKEEEKPVEMIE